MQIAQKSFIFHITKWRCLLQRFKSVSNRQHYPTRELLIIVQVHQPATRIPRTNWNTVENHERRLYHVACNPPSVQLPIPCRDYPRRAHQPAWQWRHRRHPRRRQRRRRPRHRCTRRTASTISCRSIAASSPLVIDRPASPGTATSGPARLAADLNAPSAHRACKFPARNRPPASGTIPGQEDSRRCRSRRVGHKHLFSNDRAQIVPNVTSLITDFLLNDYFSLYPYFRFYTLLSCYSSNLFLI